MKRYLYSGPMQSFALRVAHPDAGEGATKLVPVDCRPDQPVELPEDHPITVALDDAGFLEPAPAESTAEAPIGASSVEAEPVSDPAAAIEPPPFDTNPQPVEPAGAGEHQE